MTKIFKIFLIMAMCMNMILMPSLVFALAPNGGWENAGKYRVGASTVYAGRKVEDGKIYTGTTTVRPTFTQVLGKVIKVGVGATVVVDALNVLLDGVDYVMYEENNRVKFRTKEPVLCYMMGTPCFSTEEEAIAYVREYYDKFWNGKSYEFHILRQANGDPHFQAVGTYSDGRPDVRTSPYYWKNKVATAEEVAQQVIANAEKKDAQAEEFVGKIADENTSQKQKDDGYESSKRLAEDDPNASPNPKDDPNESPNPKDDPNASPNPKDDPNASPNPKDDTNSGTKDKEETKNSEFPAFCTWAIVVCDFVDWVKKDEPLQDEDKPTIENIPTPEIKENAVRWNASCPADVNIPISLQGVSSSLTLSWTPICQLLELIKPAIIACAYIGAGFIVLGIRQ